MKKATFHFLLFILAVSAFVLACRTASVLGGDPAADATATRGRATRAAQRPTFTPIPSPTDTPEPTETPEPTFTPEPTETPVPPTATRRPPTRKPATPIPPTNTLQPPTPSPSPTVALEWNTNGSASCEGGGDNESSVTGKITTANNKGAVGQRVQASAGPGGEPISENPAESNKDGNYKVTFICGGKACSGDFWIWMVDANRKQVSPFVKFSFNSGCRKGKQDFVKR